MAILDCTLRDGGYYNDWDFDQEVVDLYLESMAKSGIDMVELGLKNFPSEGFKGPCYYLTEAYLKQLKLPSGPSYGVMVDAKAILSSGLAVSEAINSLFVNACDSKLTFVRVACHFSEVTAAEKIVSGLKELGYAVYINLMQIGLRSDTEIGSVAEIVAGWEALGGVYFADSLGNMDSTDVQRVILQLRTHWLGDLGIHAHNNMGLALSNSLTARKYGVNLIDATVTGMGRGAGNAETELLLAELQANGIQSYQVAPLTKLVLQYFQPMKQKLGWGTSLHYYLAAKYDIHPTYIQKILTDNHFGMVEKVAAIDYLPRLAGKSKFDESLLSDLISPSSSGLDSQVKFECVKTISSLEFNDSNSAILIGSGSHIDKYVGAIKHFINQTQSAVFALNTGADELVELIDIYVMSHNVKKIDFSHFWDGFKKNLLIPLDRYSGEELEKIDLQRIINFPVSIEEGEFFACIDGCTVPFDLTAAYAIAALAALGFGKVYLIGFEGYGYSDKRQQEMSELFHLVRRDNPLMEFVALTPTTYPVKQGSIYAPIF